MNESILTQKYLKEAMTYDPDTGVFVWNDRPIHHFACEKDRNIFRAKYSGKVAGSEHGDGYRRVTLLKRSFLMHRLAFLYMEGSFPSEWVDHINHDRSDNRWENIRHATTWDNVRNASMFSHNSSGHPGVRWDERESKWLAYISNNGERIRIGCYTSQGDALIARKAAERVLGFHKNHGRRLRVMRTSDFEDSSQDETSEKQSSDNPDKQPQTV